MSDIKKINVGCGWETRDGWLNVDNTQKHQRVNYPITFMDATKTWPYDDNSFEYVLSEHMIEHIPAKKGLAFLKEAFRCLQSGGVIRVSCPERGFFESLPGNDDHPFVVNYSRKIFNKEPSWGVSKRISDRTLYEQGHVWVPTTQQLIDQVKKAGFVDVKSVEYGKSEHEAFNGIEVNDGVRNWESVVVEGTKA